MRAKEILTVAIDHAQSGWAITAYLNDVSASDRKKVFGSSPKVYGTVMSRNIELTTMKIW
jgi:hypothetical protein